VLNRRIGVWVVVVLAFVALTTSGCVTVGEHERIKKEIKKELEDTRNALGLKDQQIDELGKDKATYVNKVHELQNKNLSNEQDLAAKNTEIERLREQLKALENTPKESTTSGLDMTNDFGIEVYQPDNLVGVGLRLPDQVLFDSGSTTIKDQGKQALNLVISKLRTGDSLIQVIGHTDSDPVKKTIAQNPLGNVQLSTRRALAVFDYLRKNGINEKRMSVAGFGPHNPLVDNTSSDNKMRNRRVEIVMTPPSKK